MTLSLREDWVLVPCRPTRGKTSISAHMAPRKGNATNLGAHWRPRRVSCPRSHS